MKIFREVSWLTPCKNEFKQLRKRFRTLDEDLKTFCEKQLYLYHKLKGGAEGIVPIRDYRIEKFAIYKAKKFACRSLPGTGAYSGIRVIYAYFEPEDRIELIEIYYKGDKKREDRNRIDRYCKDRLREKRGNGSTV